VQHWVQLKQEKRLRFSGKRHQTRHLDFPNHPLLTEGLEVRIFPREPILLFPITCDFSGSKFLRFTLRYYAEESSLRNSRKFRAIVLEINDMHGISL
jgi:hypothetical protein